MIICLNKKRAVCARFWAVLLFSRRVGKVRSFNKSPSLQSVLIQDHTPPSSCFVLDCPLVFAHPQALLLLLLSLLSLFLLLSVSFCLCEVI